MASLTTITRFIKLAPFYFLCLLFFISCTALTPEQIQKNSPAQRVKPQDQFIIYETGIVYDKETALEWYNGDITKLDRLGTRYWMSQLDKKDPGWRLPTRSQLYDLNQKGKKYLYKTLGLTRDIFWIQNYRVYDLISNIDTLPTSYRFRHSLFKNRYYHDSNHEIRAHILVVRARQQKTN